MVTKPAVIGGSCRVTLVVAFGLLPQNFGWWQGPPNGTLSFYECRLSGEDTQRWWEHSSPSYCNQIHLNFLHSQRVDTKTLLSCPLTPTGGQEPPSETFTTLFYS